MVQIADALSATVSGIAATGALGTAAFGLTDASKAFNGGVSNVGFGSILKTLEPFRPALTSATPGWEATLRANWINGVPKEEQKTAAKTLIRLGISTTNVAALALAGHVDESDLRRVLTAVEAGTPLTVADAQVFGRFNAVIDAVMDAGYELGDQRYRNASKVISGAVAIVLALWAGGLVQSLPAAAAIRPTGGYLGSSLFWWSLLAGAVAVPIAPIAKNLASSLQSAAVAVASRP